MDPDTSPEITAEQAAFIDEKAKQLFDYAIESLDRAHAEGNNVLQWLFGVIAGGMGIIGALWVAGYFPLAIGFACVVGVSVWTALKLVPILGSYETQPPGNLAESLNEMLVDKAPRMRWREAIGMDDRIKTNLRIVETIATAVDRARRRFVRIPLWFISGTVLAYAAKFLLSGL